MGAKQDKTASQRAVFLRALCPSAVSLIECPRAPHSSASSVSSVEVPSASLRAAPLRARSLSRRRRPPSAALRIPRARQPFSAMPSSVLSVPSVITPRQQVRSSVPSVCIRGKGRREPASPSPLCPPLCSLCPLWLRPGSKSVHPCVSVAKAAANPRALLLSALLCALCALRGYAQAASALIHVHPHTSVVMATASPRATKPLHPWALPARNRRKAPIFAAMKLKEVNDARTLRDWTRLPWRIYANDRNWVPHLKQDVEKVFDPAKNKLLVEGRITRWVLYADDGSTIGRIAAFVNPKTTLFPYTTLFRSRKSVV